MTRTRTTVYVAAALLLSQAAYSGGERWWNHALRQPQVLASATPRHPAQIHLAHTGAQVMVSMAAPVAH